MAEYRFVVSHIWEILVDWLDMLMDVLIGRESHQRTSESAWYHRPVSSDDRGAPIDLVIDQKDACICVWFPASGIPAAATSAGIMGAPPSAAPTEPRHWTAGLSAYTVTYP